MKRKIGLAGGAALAVAAMTTTAAGGDFGLALEGSLGEGGFDRYVPPITNPVFNETPFITTEVKPFYAYHSIPGEFLTEGGNVQVVGIQARLAITERLGFIATTDGYSWLDFDDESTVTDTDGWNDIAIGLKYALINSPETGGILTAGLRYSIPFGDIELNGTPSGPVDGLSIDMNGIGAGAINPFISAAKWVDDFQFQGMMGAQIALDDDATSWFLASGNVDYEIAPNWYPSVGYNLFVPIEGGRQIDTGGPLDRLTGAEIFDLGTSDPQTILALSGGVRYRVSDNALIGLGADANALQDSEHVYGWRLVADLVWHY